MFLYILIPLLLFFLIIYFATPQNEQKTEQQNELFENYNFEPIEEREDKLQDVLELLERQNVSNVRINSLFQRKNNPNEQFVFIDFWTHQSTPNEDEVALVVRGYENYPESLLLATPKMEGFLAKILEFALNKIQAKHLKPVTLSNTKLALQYKISSDDPSKLLQKFPIQKLEKLLATGYFIIHLENDVMIIRLLHLNQPSTMQEDIEKLLKLAKEIKA
jgi:hypothetical protein